MSSNHEGPEIPNETTCPVCSAPMSSELSRCESCGATRGEEHRCAFCGIVAEAQSHPTLRYVCPACGGPRVPSPDPAIRRDKRVKKRLRDARKAYAAQTTWRLTAGLAGSFGALAALVLMGIIVIASPPAIAVLAGAAVIGLPLVFAFLAWRNAGKRSEDLSRSLDSAWLEATRAFAADRESTRASDLAEAFGVEPEQAQTLLAQLSARDEIATEVTDSGELALSMRLPAKVRIADKKPPPANSEEEVVEEEVEASVADQEKGRA